MNKIDIGGQSIAYYTGGENLGGTPVLLAHGFTGSAHQDYIDNGWLDTITKAGHRVAVIDHLGHGASEKPEGTPQLYTPAAHAERLIALADRLGWAQFHLIGYSMGGRIALETACLYGPRLASLTLVGVGEGVLNPDFLPPFLIDTFAKLAKGEELADDNPIKALFEHLENGGQSLPALYACARGIAGAELDRAALGAFSAPTQVIHALDDPISSQADKLAEILGAAHVPVPGTDHVSIMPDARFHSAATDFWRGV